MFKVDYKHPALGGCFGKGCLVSFGYDVVGDAYTGGNQPVPDDDPMDCGSHGTHVTGIIAAQPNELGFTGVAPGVTIGAYKVFGCSGGTGTDVLIDAANRAVSDGAQIITSSIGADAGWTVDAWTHLLGRISNEKGIPVTVAGGNSGDHGAFYPSGPSNDKDVNSVAAYDNIETTTLLSASTYDINSGSEEKFGYSAGDPKAWGNVTLPLWALTLNTSVADDGCAAFPDSTPDLSSKVVLLRRGTCTFVQKAQNAAAKGAKYILLYNNSPGAIGIGVTDVKQIVAAGMVDPNVGQTWITALASGKNVTVHMVDPATAGRIVSTVNNTDTGGAISGFSSWGPTMEMNFKPQFGAPGGNILSTLPRSFGLYGLASGTSMSTPMAAAVIALLGEARGSLNPKDTRDVLAANANPQLYNINNKFSSSLAPVAQQGGGLIQAYDAAFTTSFLDHAGFSLNDTDNFINQFSFTITNKGNKAVIYNITNTPATGVYVLGQGSIYPSQPNEVVNAPATLKFSRNRITVGPRGFTKITVKATPPTGVDVKRLALWSGYVTVNGTDGSSLSLPYEGLAGSLKSSTTLGTDGLSVTNSTDKAQQPLPAGTIFELPKPGTASPDAGIPLLLIKLALGSPSVSVDVVSSSGKTIGTLGGVPFRWLTRGTSGFYWDGQINDGSYAPPGDYKLVTHAQRVSGAPSDIDSADSITFSIKYKE